MKTATDATDLCKQKKYPEFKKKKKNILMDFFKIVLIQYV